MKKTLTAKEAAELTGLDGSSFRRYIRLGRLRADWARIPGEVPSYVIKREDFEAWLTSYRKPGLKPGRKVGWKLGPKREARDAKTKKG